MVYRTDPTTAALQRQARSDLGRRRLPEDLVDVIEALALRRPAPTTTYVHRRVSDLARDRDLPAPSYSTVRSVVAAIDPGLRTLAHDGDVAYRDRFELCNTCKAGDRAAWGRYQHSSIQKPFEPDCVGRPGLGGRRDDAQR